jgi:hypothetical protein
MTLSEAFSANPLVMKIYDLLSEPDKRQKCS